MGEDSRSAVRFQGCLDRFRAGDGGAGEDLFRHAAERLLTLTRRMSRDFSRLDRWEQAEDVCQNAALRLWGSLRVADPATAREFYRLAALQIRRELIDLARSYFGPEGHGTLHASNGGGGRPGEDADGAYDPGESTYDPERLAAWAEFHERVGGLPEEDREVFDLVWYQGLTRAEAAAVLGVSEATVKRRWRSARLAVSRWGGGGPPW